MKVIVEATTKASQSAHGFGRVWKGVTDQGTPVVLLECGLAPNSDDPVVIAQLEAERATVPKYEGPACPDCGAVMQPALQGAQIDIYEVMARFVLAAGTFVWPGDSKKDPHDLAEHYRANLERRSPEQHDRLYNACETVLEYVNEQIIQQLLGDNMGEAQGHA